MVCKGQEDYLDQQEMLERGPGVSWDKLDLRVQLENLVHLEEEACLVQFRSTGYKGSVGDRV